MCEILNSYQGILGTVIGAFLGWLLSRLNQSGKVSFFADNINIEYFANDKGGAIFKSKLNDETIYGIFTFDLDINNTSSNNRMLRKIYCSFNYSNKKLKKEIDDIETKRIIAAREDYDKVVVMNLQAKSIVKKQLSVYLSKLDISKFGANEVKINFVFTKLWGIRKEKTIYISSLINGEIRR